jgi:hypothetical protein
MKVQLCSVRLQSSQSWIVCCLAEWESPSIVFSVLPNSWSSLHICQHPRYCTFHNFIGQSLKPWVVFSSEYGGNPWISYAFSCIVQECRPKAKQFDLWSNSKVHFLGSALTLVSRKVESRQFFRRSGCHQKLRPFSRYRWLWASWHFGVGCRDVQFRRDPTLAFLFSIPRG